MAPHCFLQGTKKYSPIHERHMTQVSDWFHEYRQTYVSMTENLCQQPFYLSFLIRGVTLLHFQPYCPSLKLSETIFLFHRRLRGQTLIRNICRRPSNPYLTVTPVKDEIHDVNTKSIPLDSLTVTEVFQM